MNQRKSLILAIKSMPEVYITEETRIAPYKNHQVIAAAPELQPIIWSQEEGWRVLVV